MNGTVGFAVFVVFLIVAFVVAGWGYSRGWWMRDYCPTCGAPMPCPSCGHRYRHPFE